MALLDLYDGARARSHARYMQTSTRPEALLSTNSTTPRPARTHACHPHLAMPLPIYYQLAHLRRPCDSERPVRGVVPCLKRDLGAMGPGLRDGLGCGASRQVRTPWIELRALRRGSVCGA
jgi:hypothetical protein